MKSKLVFGREPAVWLGLIAILIQLFGAFVAPISQTGQDVLNGAVAAGFGLIVAWKVHDGVIAALGGFATAALIAAVHYGLDWSEGKRTLLVMAITLSAQAFVRQNVTAPVPAGAVRKPTPVS